MTRPKPKARKPRVYKNRFGFLMFCEWVKPAVFIDMRCNDAKSARRLAKWLLRFADWAEHKERKGKK